MNIDQSELLKLMPHILGLLNIVTKDEKALLNIKKEIAMLLVEYKYSLAVNFEILQKLDKELYNQIYSKYLNEITAINKLHTELTNQCENNDSEN